MSTFDQWASAVKAAVHVLKRRFPNLTAEEALDLATEIVQAVIAGHMKGEPTDG